jgi:hypothetical protein
MGRFLNSLSKVRILRKSSLMIHCEKITQKVNTVLLTLFTIDNLNFRALDVYLDATFLVFIDR